MDKPGQSTKSSVLARIDLCLTGAPSLIYGLRKEMLKGYGNAQFYYRSELAHPPRWLKAIRERGDAYRGFSGPFFNSRGCRQWLERGADNEQGNERRRNGARSPCRPGCRTPVRVSGRRRAADLR